MGEIYQPAAPALSSASKTTRLLVVLYHFLVASIIAGALVLDWMTGNSSQDDRFILKAMSLIAAPLVLAYFITAWGILKWKNWSRGVALVLNWINIVAAALNLHRIETKGAISVVLSCLVLWWLSTPVVKLEFRRGSVAR